jgi:hypothetical protein
MPRSRWHQDAEVAELIAHLDQPDKYEDWEALTKDEIAVVLKEIDRCRKDFVYAARNYFWISNKKLGDQLLTLLPSQELILQKILEMKAKGLPQKLVIIKARQLGCSTLIEALICWRTVFFSNVNALVVSTDINHAAYALWPIMQFIYDRLPWWLQPMCSMRKAEEGMYFENPKYEERRQNPGLNSRIYVKGASSGNAGQGIKLSAVHISEFADFEDRVAKDIIDEDMVNALVEDAGTFAILESTAKGANRYAHRLWKRCMELESEAEWFPLFLPFFFDPGHIRKVTVDFRLEPQDQRMRERVVSEWVRCDYEPCQQYHSRFVRGEDRSETLCATCGTGTVHAFIITDEQLHWIQHRRKNAKRDDESMKRLLQEQSCLVAGTLVSTNDGIVPIETALNAAYTECGVVTGWFNHGERETVLLTTDLGRQIACTPDHRIFLPSGECVEVQTLQPGQEIALSAPRPPEELYTASWGYTPTCKMSIQVTEDWGRFLGYFMGDGCWSAGVRFACDSQDEDVADDISAVCGRLIGRPSRKERSKTQKMTVVASTYLDWRRILDGLGCLKSRGSDRKLIRRVCVPECIFRSPRAVIRQFLSALFECDGHAYKGTPRTTFFTCHEQFARDVQLLLLSFGINSKISKEDKTNGEGRLYTGRSVQLKAEASNLFHEHIGFISQRKRTSACVRPPAKNCMSRSRNVMVDYVKSVEPSGKAVVYDLTIAGSHRFGANGILVHNSSAEEAFQVTGYQVFGQKAQDFANACVRQPIAVGDFDNNGRFHGCNPKAPKVSGQWGDYHPCFQEDCQLDHSYESEAPLQIWEWPVPNAEYCIGGDVAEGLGGKADYSVGVVSRFTATGSANCQVATWRSNTIDPIAFAAKLYHLGICYNTALMAVECNKYDVCIGQLRCTLNYPNTYRWKHMDSVNIMSNKLGWYTDIKSRPRLYQTFRAWLNHEAYQIRSRIVCEQMKSFVKDDFDDVYAGADSEEHDDDLIATMISLFCAVEGNYSEALGLAVPKHDLTMGNAQYHVTCLSCHHTWPEVTVSDPIIDQYGFGPELDADKRVAQSGGTRCPICGSRTISINRNAESRVGMTDADLVLQESGSWSPDRDFMEATIPDYDML